MKIKIQMNDNIQPIALHIILPGMMIMLNEENVDANCKTTNKTNLLCHSKDKSLKKARKCYLLRLDSLNGESRGSSRRQDSERSTRNTLRGNESSGE